MANERKDQLCWDCKNATGGCEWLEPVPGWTAKKVPRLEYANTTANKRLGFTYKIAACPKFEKG